VPDPAAWARAILGRLRDAGFAVCATEKLLDAVDFLDDVRQAGSADHSRGAVAKGKS
jgi:hypothetical protein